VPKKLIRAISLIGRDLRAKAWMPKGMIEGQKLIFSITNDNLACAKCEKAI
jgi:hypothetical protein